MHHILEELSEIVVNTVLRERIEKIRDKRQNTIAGKNFNENVSLTNNWEIFAIVREFLSAK
jgi:hypothetical protein